MRLFRALFGIGILLIVVSTAYAATIVPEWALPICIVVAFVSLGLLPPLIGAIVDPANSRAIRAHLEQLGASEVKVSAYPNHYGVHFRFGGRKHYAKCLVLKHGTFKWKGSSPEQMINAGRVA
jgi:hypothetical protein